MFDCEIVKYITNLRNNVKIKELEKECQNKGYSLNIDLFLDKSFNTIYIQGSFAVCSNNEVVKFKDFDENGYACFTTTLGIVKRRRIILYSISENDDLQEQIHRLLTVTKE